MLLISHILQFAANDGLDFRQGLVSALFGYCSFVLKNFVGMVIVIAGAAELTSLSGSTGFGLMLIFSVAVFLVLRLRKAENLAAARKEAQSYANFSSEPKCSFANLPFEFPPLQEKMFSRIVSPPTKPPCA